MGAVQIVSIIRDRSQLTIPESIRAVRQWIQHDAVVTLSTERADEIVIRPHKRTSVNWEMIWHNVHLARSFRGKRGSLSAFIAKDREERM